MLLALFPLQLALFPGEEISLHIFEPRYKQLIIECRDEGIRFGIPPVDAGRVSKVGTEVSLVKIVKTYDSGEMDIVVRGERVFHVEEFQPEIPDKLYSGGMVTFQENDSQVTPDIQRNLVESYEELNRLLHGADAEPLELVPNLSFYMGPRVGLSLGQRLSILRMNKEYERQAYLLRYIEHSVEAIRKQRSIGTKLGGGNGRSSHVGD